MPRLRKRPCRNCRRWFYPDPRVGDRQRSCGRPECQAVRRQKTQANWRRRHPSYAAAYRIDQRHAGPDSDPEPIRVPAPLQELPWDIAKDQFGGKGVDFMAVMCKSLVRVSKDQSPGYPIDPKGVPGNNPAFSQKTRAGGAHTENQAPPHHAANFGVSSIGPPPSPPPGPPPGPVPAPAGLAG